jgi:hypothetical protein
MTAPSKIELAWRYGPPDDCADDGELTNVERAEMGWAAVEAFIPLHCTADPYRREDLEGGPETGVAIEVIGDLICNLLHLATMCGEDAERVHAAGLHHFEAEVGLGYHDAGAD